MAVVITKHIESQVGVPSDLWSSSQLCSTKSFNNSLKDFVIRGSRLQIRKNHVSGGVLSKDTEDRFRFPKTTVIHVKNKTVNEDFSTPRLRVQTKNTHEDGELQTKNATQADARRVAFRILLRSMEARGLRILIRERDVTITYSGGAKELQVAKNLENIDCDIYMAKKINNALTHVVKENTIKWVDYLTETLDICSKYLAKRFVDKCRINRKNPNPEVVLSDMMLIYPVATYHGVNNGKKHSNTSISNEVVQVSNDIISEIKNNNVAIFSAKVTNDSMKNVTDKSATKYASNIMTIVVENEVSKDISETVTRLLHKKDTIAEITQRNTIMNPTMKVENKLDCIHVNLQSEATTVVNSIISEIFINSSYFDNEEKDADQSTDSVTKQCVQNMLYEKMRKKQDDILHQNVFLKLTYSEAVEWLHRFERKRKLVQTSIDVKYLQQKFEDQLFHLMENEIFQIKPVLYEVVIEKSSELAEIFLFKEYRNRVQNIIVKEMQKRRRDIMFKLDDKIETYASGAVRLILAKSYKEKNPDHDVSRRLVKTLQDLTWLITPSKLQGFMKEHIKIVADYLSIRITKPDPTLTSYVTLLHKLELAGDCVLITGKIKISYEDCAKYLRSLLSYAHCINKPNKLLQAFVESKLNNLVAKNNVDEDIIKQSAKMLTSFITDNLECAEFLEEVVEQLNKAGEQLLVGHGGIYKSCKDGANLLRGKTADQLKVEKADSVAYRKIEKKLSQIVKSKMNVEAFLKLVTKYLAVRLLDPFPAHVFKHRDVFAQCDMDFKDILLQPRRKRCEFTSVTKILKEPSELCVSVYETVSKSGTEAGDTAQLCIVHKQDTEKTINTEASANKNLSILKVLDWFSSESSPATTASSVKENNISSVNLLKECNSSTLCSLEKSRTPIVPSGKLSDWRAIIVNLMWNTKAWQSWIQEHIDIGNNNLLHGSEGIESWKHFENRMTRELRQWRLYNVMSREMTLHLQIEHFQIKKTTFASVDYYQGWLHQLLSVENVFNQWMLWFSILMKETKTLRKTASNNVLIDQLCWDHYMRKTKMFSEDWESYIKYLSIAYTGNFNNIISSWLPAWSAEDAIWVYSAYGAVPCGAAAGGIFNWVPVWIAKVIHGSEILPAAVHPTKHCALLYAENTVHYYTEYKVLCNAKVSWVPWQADMPGEAVLISPGIHIGRIKHKESHLIGTVRANDHTCYVIIGETPVFFHDFEILVRAS